MRIWSHASVHIRSPEGASLSLVGLLTVCDDYIIVSDSDPNYWTALPITDVAVIERVLEDENEDEEEAEEVDKFIAFERFYQELKRRNREP